MLQTSIHVACIPAGLLRLLILILAALRARGKRERETARVHVHEREAARDNASFLRLGLGPRISIAIPLSATMTTSFSPPSIPRFLSVSLSLSLFFSLCKSAPAESRHSRGPHARTHVLLRKSVPLPAGRRGQEGQVRIGVMEGMENRPIGRCFPTRGAVQSGGDLSMNHSQRNGENRPAGAKTAKTPARDSNADSSLVPSPPPPLPGSRRFDRRGEIGLARLRVRISAYPRGRSASVACAIHGAELRALRGTCGSRRALDTVRSLLSRGMLICLMSRLTGRNPLALSTRESLQFIRAHNAWINGNVVCTARDDAGLLLLRETARRIPAGPVAGPSRVRACRTRFLTRFHRSHSRQLKELGSRAGRLGQRSLIRPDLCMRNFCSYTC